MIGIQPDKNIYLGYECNVKITYWNARSLKNKTVCIHDYLTSKSCDIFCFSETWLSLKTEEGDPNQVVLAEAIPDGFVFQHIPRQSGLRAGGVGMAVKEEVSANFNLPLPKCDQYERMQSVINTGFEKVNVVVVYRPPPTKKNGLKLSLFWPQWVKLLSSLCSMKSSFIIIGDLNFHLDKVSNRTTKKFKNILSEFGLVQHVKEPTHIHGHILDVVITRAGCPSLKDVWVTDLNFTNDTGDPIKDHLAVQLTIKSVKSIPKQKTFQYRNWKGVDHSDFKRDLLNRIGDTSTLSPGPVKLVQWYTSNLKELSDVHAPLKTKVVKHKYNPWYSTETNELKKTKRQLERKWLKSKADDDYETYRKHCHKMYKAIRLEKLQYNQTKIEEADKDYKKMFSLTNHLMGKSIHSKCPKLIPKEQLPDAFADFFTEKISNIQKDIELSARNLPETEIEPSSVTNFDKLCTFDLSSCEEIETIMLSMPDKQCPLDLVPMWFIKKNLSLFLPLFLDIVNSSLSTGILPTSLKTALVRPILKDPSSDPEVLKNYRPVSNLPILAKIIEKVVFKRLDSHIQANSLFDPNQSAYRKDHSTETCLLRMQNDILCSLDQGLSVAVVVLDISAAFDSVHHNKLIACFKEKFGIDGVALQWLTSYLTGRKQMVMVEEIVSRIFGLDYGFPQGAVLAGLLYNVFSADLGKVAVKYPVSHKGFADDNTWYAAFTSKNAGEVLEHLQNCLTASKAWMIMNDFKVNEDKTQIMYFTPQKQLYSGQLLTFEPSSLEPPLTCIKSLGVHLDQCMTMENQINAVTKSAYFHIKNVSKIRKYLTLSSAKTVVQSLVVSRLDYGNALLGNLPQRLIKKLQRAQNSAARMLFKKSRRCCITPVLKKLHWLPIKYRIKFKVLLLTFKCLKGSAPAYLKELLKPYRANRLLRSNTLLQGTLSVSRFKKRKFGGRAFSNVAATLWNELPHYIRTSASVSQFKTNLKTHFYSLHFTKQS